jgi:hypothetical protein
MNDRYSPEPTFDQHVSAETSLTDRFTFNCGHSPGTAKIGGS